MLHSVGLSMACFAVAYLDRQWFTDQGIGLVTTNVLILAGFVSAATGLWLLLPVAEGLGLGLANLYLACALQGADWYCYMYSVPVTQAVALGTT
jgi:hypothetical protein